MAEHDKSDIKPGYETTDAHIMPLALTGLSMAVLVIVSFISMIVLFKVFAYYQPTFDDPVPSLASARITSDAPRLQIDPPAQKIALELSNKDILSSYGWVDEQVKVARIPIERALSLASRGQLPLINQEQTAQ
jgi:hypothetical protein